MMKAELMAAGCGAGPGTSCCNHPQTEATWWSRTATDEAAVESAVMRFYTPTPSHTDGRTVAAAVQPEATVQFSELGPGCSAGVAG